MQVCLDKNIYFQQCGDTVDGVYVNEQFISIKVGDEELPEQELLELATSLYDICKNNKYISNEIQKIAKEYEENPYRDGRIIFVGRVQ